MKEFWVNAKVDEVIILMKNGSSAKQYKDNVGLPITRIETISNEKINLNRVRYIKGIDKKEIDKHGLCYGDILLSHINSDQHLGKTAVYKNQAQILIHGINLLLLRPHELINSNFLNYQFKFLRYKGKFIEEAQRAVNQSSINQRKLKQFEIEIPPLPEQRAIVAKIEQLFSELDNGIANFNTAKQKLEIYRQAVLKKAFEGELTREWREQQTDLPTGEELLVQIQEERERYHEEQIAKWKEAVAAWEANGKEGKKPGKPRKIWNLETPLKGIDFKSEKEMQWVSLKVKEISHFITKGTTPKSSELNSTGAEIPFLKVYNLTFQGTLDFTINPTFVSKKIHDEYLGRSIIYPNDVLMNIVGPPLGKVSIVPNTFEEWNINQAIVRFRLINGMLPKYLAYFLLSKETIHKISRKAKATAGQFNLTLEICRNIEIPLCNLLEQNQVVLELESRLSVCDKFIESIDESLQKAEALRQSILKKAFEGKLLTDEELEICKQEEDWEPAEKLLARIKSEKP